MDSDKPSNPSSKSGNSDDLIEEMAKLMGNPSPSPKPESETSSAPQQSAPRPEPEGSDNAAFDSDSDADDSAEPAGPSAPEPVAHSTPAAQSAEDDAPGWLPLSNRKPAPQPPAATVEPDSPSQEPEPQREPERQEPSFALRPQRQEPAESAETQTDAETQAPEPTPSAGWKPESVPDGNPSRFDFGLTRETPRTPEPEAPQPSPTSDFDFGFGSDRPAEPAPEPTAGPKVPEEAPAPTNQPAPDEVDPIAALIRDQLKQPAAETAPEPRPAAPSRPNEPQPAPASRSDNFNVPPVFGLGGDTSKRSMSGSDALDDIENLIGNAVRVDLPPEAENTPSQQQHGPVPQPPVRPHQPRQPAPQSNPAGNVDAAEAAILAAMASNNADSAGQQALRAEQPSGKANADFSESGDSHILTDDEQPRSGIRWGRILMPVAALLLLGAIGFAGYTFLTATPPEGEAPVLVADSDPNKVTPEVDESEDAGDSLVFSDDAESDGSGEQLVSRDQSGDTGSDDAIRQIITADTTENGLANRRVRTVTVRPDGTIVSGDDLVAGSEALSVDRPEVPALPDDAVTSALADTEVAGLTLDQPAADTSADLVDNTPANLVPVNGTSVPFPESRPDNLSALRASVPAQTTPLAITQPEITTTQPSVTATPQSPVVSEQPAAVDLLGDLQDVTPSPTPTTVPASSVESAVPSAADPPPQSVTAAAWVQLASQRDQAVANSEAGRLSRLYSSALAGRAPVVQQADLADRGVWYRVLVPAGSLGEAQSICSQITSIGGDCFARAN